MSFFNSIPTTVPGLSQLAAVNDKVLKPGLSVAQTAKGYMTTMRKDKKNNNQTHTIVIDRLSRRDTSKSDQSDPIDHEYTDSGSAQRQRVQELLNSRALRSPFPDDLPKRPEGKQPVNKWKVGFFAIIFIFAAAMIPLAILAGRGANPDCDPNQPGRQSQATVMSTTTDISLLSFTKTSVKTSLSTTTDVKVKTTFVTDTTKSTRIGSVPKDSAVSNVTPTGHGLE